MTRLVAKVKLPKKLFDIRAGKAQVKKSLDELAKEAKDLFAQTTATWKNKPAIEIEAQGNKRVIRIEGKVYTYVDKGTEPHPIFPRKARVLAWPGGFRAKTRQNVVGSSPGGKSGKMVFAKYVLKHPGTKPRNFSVIIRDRMQKRLDKEAEKILKAYKVK